MRLFDLVALLMVLAAGFSYLNFTKLKLPPTIGLMALTLLLSVGLKLVGAFVPSVAEQTRAVSERLDLNEALLHGMLGFLLFAGACVVTKSMSTFRSARSGPRLKIFHGNLNLRSQNLAVDTHSRILGDDG